LCHFSLTAFDFFTTANMVLFWASTSYSFCSYWFSPDSFPGLYLNQFFYVQLAVFSPCFMFGCLLDILFNSEDRGSMFLWNKLLPYYMASHSRR
jgi:hypothetical protein